MNDSAGDAPRCTLHSPFPVPVLQHQHMASLNPPIVDDLSQLAIPRHAVILGLSGGSREVLLACRDGMHLDVRRNGYHP